MIAKTKLASLAAVGASAIAAAPDAAADSIIASPVFDVSIGFSSNSAPASGRHIAASFVFNSLMGGPAITFKAGSFGGQTTNTRFVRFYGVGMQLSGNGVERFSAGATMNTQAEIGNGFNVGDRAWGSSSTLNNLNEFTDKYFLFRFLNGTTIDYGWMEASMSVTLQSSSAAAAGPNLTVLQWAYDDTGAKIAAGDVGPTPEPSTASEAAMAALILGAVGLRRWRKVRRERMPAQ